ncbi:DoxX family protein (plasmid) [Halarchaeum sp. CBA1220]|uniref:DoxX family protein n=1 Tax=Halarchaeum sp. CBA1220 TaxID=1853682 RepID=UPI000F3A9851|nr:DoxX family protein [Halarchaeum sp. CBA1220]QLC35117.1 DoxX family protein [Halarchaeum sp. CBA1220]
MRSGTHPRYRRLAVATLLAVLCTARPAAAHVDYTAEGGGHVDTVQFLVDVLSHPFHVAVLVGGAVAVVAAAVTYLRRRPLQRDIAVFRAAVTDYADLLPWLLRLSFGLPLVGAGFAGYFISPAVTPTGSILAPLARLVQIGLGFALLFGLATRVAAFLGLLAYLGVLLVRPELLLAMEYVAGFTVLILLGSGRPSADAVLETIAAADGTTYGRIDPVHRVTGVFRDRVAPSRRFVPTIVRAGLGVTFLYLGVVEKLLAPGPALQVVAKYNLTQVVPVDPGLWVLGAALAEIALGTALILGLFTRADALTALLMFTLTLFGLPDDPVLAHISLFGLASALIITGAGPHALDTALPEWLARRTADDAAT